MTDAPVVISWGELLWDLFPDRRRLGGCAANVAYHTARLGDRALLVSRVGDDELGHAALDELDRFGVDARFVQRDPEAPTGTVSVRIDDGEPTFSIARQAAWDRIEWDAALNEHARRAAALCYGTLAQRTPLNTKALTTLLGRLPASCKRVCDLNVRAPYATRSVVDAAIAHADAVKLNTDEARYLEELFEVDDAVTWLLRERDVQLIALTRGRNGAVLTTPTESNAHPGFVVETRGGDSVGAGDAFTAVLAHGFLRGGDIEHINESANRYASFVASKSGAMPPISAELAASIR